VLVKAKAYEDFMMTAMAHHHDRHSGMRRQAQARNDKES
jgi:hypothetical protein